MKHIGTVKTETFKRSATGKHWKLENSSIELITIENARLYENSAEWFKNEFSGKEKMARGYTAHGFLPVELISIAPDNLTKIVRTFTYTTEG